MTYVNEALCHESFIDYVLVSDAQCREYWTLWLFSGYKLLWAFAS